MSKQKSWDSNVEPGLLLERSIESELQLTKKFHLKTCKLKRFSHQKIRDLTDLLNKSFEKDLSSADLAAIILITEAMQKIIFDFWHRYDQDISIKLEEWLIDSFGSYNIDNLKLNYYTNFEVETESESYLFPEIITTWLTNINPAFVSYDFLFSDLRMQDHIPYYPIMATVSKFFDQDEFSNNLEENLIKKLQSPVLRHPHSIQGQLEYIRDNWADLLGDFYGNILQGLDLIKEAQIFNWGGSGEIELYNFDNDDDEYENFSKDSDWMPRLVLIAKSTYVWLDQLSKKYHKEIIRLDQIPETELRELSDYGFTGIWFIGLWERSRASQRIKHLIGNNEAIASAYSLDDYHIATSLGGEKALENLKHKASKYNVRIGCDMVPNHTGIDSKWMKEHPEWYMQLPYQPYPNYSFNGEDLSNDPNFSVHIEDHYFDKTDAAVVFKHYKQGDGKTRYIYHGNDGTGIPWNDTAQLNYLLPEVREALIQKIISIAKEFPIIRFDAAMTLAKKHIQRLWFPEPGTGGDIPTRSEFGLSKAEFNQHMPEEFWREVVDRVAEEAPNTLLLAEAFWMMEGYFVRTLGMHRVYNSAFMHMLKNEENGKYRQSIFNIIEFNPQILKRFVNFMSNPDEDTAIEQFGGDDKYFGVCVLMTTMPGLPMFAHGQIEGFTEKYGMEFSKARMDEQINKHLVARHQREIFPILKRRILFSEVDNFLLYDFKTISGDLNDNVFAYSNKNHDHFSLVVFNNKYDETEGFIQFANTTSQAEDNNQWYQKEFTEALDLNNSSADFIIYRDLITKMYFLRKTTDIKKNGFFMKLDAYKYSVFVDFRFESDIEGKFSQLHDYLAGTGTPNIDVSMKKIKLGPLLTEFENFVNPQFINNLIGDSKTVLTPAFLKEIDYRADCFLNFISEFIGIEEEEEATTTLSQYITSSYSYFKKNETSKNQQKFYYITLLLNYIEENVHFDHPDSWLDDYLLKNTILSIKEFDYPLMGTIKPLINFYRLNPETVVELSQVFQHFIQEEEIMTFLQVHTYNDISWFSKERMDEFQSLVKIVLSNKAPVTSLIEKKEIKRFLNFLEIVIEDSKYKFKSLIDNMI